MQTIKNLKIEIKDKNGQIQHLNSIIVEKDKSIAQVTALYSNKVKAMNKMKSEKTELTGKMNNLEEQLTTEIECSSILQQKLSKVYQKHFED